MERTKQSVRPMVVLIILCIWASQAGAQQRQALMTSPKHNMNSVSNSVEASPVYKVYENKGKIILHDGKHETIVSKDPDASKPLIYDQEVYFIKKGNKLSGATICAYNIQDKTTTDVLRKNAGNSNFSFQNEITQMMLDKNSGKLYFSTVSVNKQGYSDYITWHYDIAAKQLVIYKDGEIESIDNAGNQSIAFHGVDRNGSYVSRSVIGTDGKLQKLIGKEYKAVSANK